MSARKIFLKVFFAGYIHMSYFGVPWDHSFGILRTSPLGFQNQSRFYLIRIAPLVLHIANLLMDSIVGALTGFISCPRILLVI